jgi:hypothetical protein
MHKLPAANAPVAVGETEHVTQLRLARELALGDVPAAVGELEFQRVGHRGDRPGGLTEQPDVPGDVAGRVGAARSHFLVGERAQPLAAASDGAIQELNVCAGRGGPVHPRSVIDFCRGCVPLLGMERLGREVVVEEGLQLFGGIPRRLAVRELLSE